MKAKIQFNIFLIYGIIPFVTFDKAYYSMKYYYINILAVVFITCKSIPKKTDYQPIIPNSDFTITFGSCNKQYKNNILWDDILALQPNVWIWGGDNIYSDTNNMEKLKNDYEQQNKQEGYTDIVKNIPIMATWDDHDYGLNDGGTEFEQKKGSQEAFLDFLNVANDSPRRKKEGVYHSKTFTTTKGSVKIIVLDTRYFRTALTKSTSANKRYQPNEYGKGTMLGTVQWNWLKDELNNSTADFTILVSSIQVLSNKHGFEKWANFPHEVDKLFNLIASSKAKNVIILSGDRHISEFSKKTDTNISYPIVDFTSSGLTHSYSKFKSEENPFRVGNVVSSVSFGILLFDFDAKKVLFQIRGDNNTVLQELFVVY